MSMERGAEMFERVGKRSALMLMISVIFFSLLSYFFPANFAWLGPLGAPLYAISIFFMGTQISWSMVSPFRLQARPIWISLLSQWVIMPCLAFLIANNLQLSPEEFLGLMIIACCPGGLATPLWVYLSRGDVPLTISIKLIHTLLSPILIPILFWLFTAQTVQVPLENILLLFSLVIFVPFLLGISVGSSTFRISMKSVQWLPFLIIITVCVTVTSSIAQADLPTLWKMVTEPLLLAVILLYLVGWLLSWGVAWWLGCSLPQQISISLETPSLNTSIAIWVVTASLSPLSLMTIMIYHLWQYLAGSFISYLFSDLIERKRDLRENHSTQNK